MRTRPILDWPNAGGLAPSGDLDDVENILAGGALAVLSGAGLYTQ
jgi:hypothetical protein